MFVVRADWRPQQDIGDVSRSEAGERSRIRSGLIGGTMKSWMCVICGFIYEEEDGVPEEGIAAGTRWEDVPPNWVCPDCGARKEDFEMVEV